MTAAKSTPTGPDLHAEIRGAPREMRRIGARDQRLGRRAAGIDASPADQLALDERDLLARSPQAGRPSAGRPGRRRSRSRRSGGSSERPDDDQAEDDGAGVLDEGGGRVAPERLRQASRISAPPYVPITAPITPAMRPTIHEPPATPIVAPDSAPLTIRAPNCIGTFRLGVEGSWSVTSSTIASSREDPGRPGIAHEGEPGVVEIETAQPRRPAHGGQRRESARTGHDAGQERKSVKHCLVLLLAKIGGNFRAVCRRIRSRAVGAQLRLRLHPHIVARRVAERFQLAVAGLAGGDLFRRLRGQPGEPVGPPGARRLLRLRDPDPRTCPPAARPTSTGISACRPG